MTTLDSMPQIISNFLAPMTDREEGQDMIEYGLLAALISIVAIVIILGIGGPIQSFFGQIQSTLSSL